MELATSEGDSPSCQGCYYPLAENWVNSQSLFLMGFALLPALQGQPSPPGYVGKGEERLFPSCSFLLLYLVWTKDLKERQREAITA